MGLILLSALLVVLFSWLLYSIYKTRRFKGPGQVIVSIVGALLLIYILYTCNSDN